MKKITLLSIASASLLAAGIATAATPPVKPTLPINGAVVVGFAEYLANNCLEKAVKSSSYKFTWNYPQGSQWPTSLTTTLNMDNISLAGYNIPSEYNRQASLEQLMNALYANSQYKIPASMRIVTVGPATATLNFGGPIGSIPMPITVNFQRLNSGEFQCNVTFVGAGKYFGNANVNTKAVVSSSNNFNFSGKQVMKFSSSAN